MSSLAASRADNFYFPPEYSSREHGSLSKFNVKGYKGHNQYETSGIIRFELPFDGWCIKCKRHHSKGTRFNAKKDKAGKYHSTTIFSFDMKCQDPTCDQRFLIKTDPENRTYDFFDGIRKMMQDYEPDSDDHVINTIDDETRNKLFTDSIYRLQHQGEDKRKAETVKERLENLQDLQDVNSKFDYDINSFLRTKNRKIKKRNKELENEGISLGLSIPLVEPSENDKKLASEANFKITQYKRNLLKNERIKLNDIKSESIFNNASLSSKNKKRGISEIKNDTLISNSSNKIGSEASRQNSIKSAMLKQSICAIDTSNMKINNNNNNNSNSNIYSKKKVKNVTNNNEINVSVKNIIDSLSILNSYGDSDSD
jgi:hypothetical protein